MDIEFLTENLENFRENITSIYRDWKGEIKVVVYFTDRKPLVSSKAKHVVRMYGVHCKMLEVDGWRFSVERIVKVKVTFYP